MSGMIGQAAEAVLAGWRHPGLASGRLPDTLRPRSLVTEGGLTVGQMVLMPLRTEAIPIAPGAAVEIGFGDLGKVTLGVRKAKP